jgi:hypothetical protein
VVSRRDQVAAPVVVSMPWTLPSAVVTTRLVPKISKQPTQLLNCTTSVSVVCQVMAPVAIETP